MMILITDDMKYVYKIIITEYYLHNLLNWLLSLNLSSFKEVTNNRVYIYHFYNLIPLYNQLFLIKLYYM